MRLKQYGFFAELDHGDDEGGSLSTLRGTAAYDDEQRQRIVSYLKNGQLYIGCPGAVVDVLSDENNTIGSPNILTDGEWAWPEDLAYYVANYDVPIPDGMRETMERNGWFVANEIELAELEL